MVDIEEREGSGPEDDGSDQETDTLQDYRILWYSCDQQRIAALLRGDGYQLRLIQRLGLTETFRLKWPKAATKGVLEFVRGFDMGTKTSQFRGRSFVLTKELLRNVFKLPQGEFSPYKTKWYGVDGMFSPDRVDGNPHALKTLVSPYDQWKVVIRLVQELLLGKSKPSAVNKKEMWYFFAHLVGDLKKKRWKKSLNPKVMPDWADLVFDDLLTEINNLKKHLSQVGKPGIKKYPACCGTAVTYLLIQWGYSLVTLTGDNDSIGDKLVNAACRTLIAGEGSKDTEQWEEQNQGEVMALVPFEGPDQDVLKQAIESSNSQSKPMAEEILRLLESNAKLERTSAGLKEANGALIQEQKNADEVIGLFRHQIRLLKDSNATLHSNNSKLIVKLDEAKEARRTAEQAMEAAKVEVVATEEAANRLQSMEQSYAADNQTNKDTEARVQRLAESMKEMAEKVKQQRQKIQERGKEEERLLAEIRNEEQSYEKEQQAKKDREEGIQSLQESLNEKTNNRKKQERQIQEREKEEERLLAEIRNEEQSYEKEQQAKKDREERIQSLQESLNEKTNNRKKQERQIQEREKEEERLLAEIRNVEQSLEKEQQAKKNWEEGIQSLQDSLKNRTDALQVEQQAGCRKQQGSQEELECNAPAPLKENDAELGSLTSSKRAIFAGHQPVSEGGASGETLNKNPKAEKDKKKASNARVENITVENMVENPISRKLKKPRCANVAEDENEEFISDPVAKWKVPKRESRTRVDDSELRGEKDIPPEMTKGLNLLQHQRKGLHWMCSMEDDAHESSIKGGILADDQGMGKTIQLIGLMLLHRQKGKPTLIVCPNSVLYQWQREIQDKVAEGYLSTLVYHGDERHSYDSKLKTFDVVITTYGTLIEGSKADRDAVQGVNWLRVILDECHLIRNKRSARAQAVCRLEAEFRWCVSGTPISNSPFELYSYFKFMQYEPLSSDKQQIEHRRRLGKIPAAKAHRQMHEHMVKTTLRRVKDLLKGLPGKRTVRVDVDFVLASNRVLYDKYNALLKAYSKGDKDGIKRRGSDVLVIMQKLRQVCLHWNLVCLAQLLPTRKIANVTQEKLEELVHALLEIEGGKCADCQAPWETRVMEPSHVNICGHALCQDCETSLEESGKTMKCPVPKCRGVMKMKSLYALEELLGAPQLQGEQEEFLGFENENNAPKFEAVMDYLCSLPAHEMEGFKEPVSEKAIIFSQWPSVFPYLQRVLEFSGFEYRRVDGGMTLPQREAALHEFKTNPEVKVILLSLYAANTGLNITAANHVLLLDHSWNPAAEDQAVDRAYRIGQKKEVKVVHFVVKRTIESTIIARQARKRTMASQCLYGPEGPYPPSHGEVGDVLDLVASYFEEHDD